MFEDKKEEPPLNAVLGVVAGIVIALAIAALWKYVTG